VSFDVELGTVGASNFLPQSLTVWHSPPACVGPLPDLKSAVDLDLPVNALCVSHPCDGWGCNLTVALPQATQYQLKVRRGVGRGSLAVSGKRGGGEGAFFVFCHPLPLLAVAPPRDCGRCAHGCWAPPARCLRLLPGPTSAALSSSTACSRTAEAG
jgi:hypothetical protein